MNQRCRLLIVSPPGTVARVAGLIRDGLGFQYASSSGNSSVHLVAEPFALDVYGSSVSRTPNPAERAFIEVDLRRPQDIAPLIADRLATCYLQEIRVEAVAFPSPIRETLVELYAEDPPRTVSTLARRVGVSSRTVRRQWTEDGGSSLSDALRRLGLLRGCRRLMWGNRKVREVCVELGIRPSTLRRQAGRYLGEQAARLSPANTIDVLREVVRLASALRR